MVQFFVRNIFLWMGVMAAQASHIQEDLRADKAYVQNVYAAALRSLSYSESTFSSNSFDSDSDGEDLRREHLLMECIGEKDRSIRDLLAIVRQQETEIAALRQRYVGYESYKITLKRPLKYVTNTHFAAKTWMLTPEQRFGLANMVMPEAGGLLEIKKDQR